jgi:hypothetical protein
VTVLVGAGVLAASRRYLPSVDAEKNELDEITNEAFLISQCQSGECGEYRRELRRNAG